MAQHPIKYRITDFRLVPSTAADRRGKQDALVTYELPGVAVDSVAIPSEDASLDRVKEAVASAARNKLKYIGLVGEL